MKQFVLRTTVSIRRHHHGAAVPRIGFLTGGGIGCWFELLLCVMLRLYLIFLFS
uniref:Uncharacterized protein n=1 Tax=Rhizophora mucronata TaxID=61149 RepID=A0A2P2QAB0_RHIMU